ncbi:MAG TPA: flippase [Candidatus Kapabacteria bacterium]|nr:flippase [Candidatus Kapabacteria bacterium]
MSVAKNTAFMTAASVGQKIISFFYFTLIARLLGPEDTGKYFLALSFTTIFVIFVDLGLTNVFVRESAKAKENMQEYFSTILSVKMILAVLTYATLVCVTILFGYDVELRSMIYLSGITMLFDTLHLSLYGVLRSIGKLKYEAMSIVASQFVTLILGGFFLYFRLPIIFLILAFTISSFLNVCFATWAVRSHHIALRPRFNKTVFFVLARIAIPFALAAVFARFYSYIDSLLLSKYLGQTAVGWYSIPYKITYAFQFIPLALVAALYPRFSEFFATDKTRLAYLFERGMKYLLIIVLPIAVGIAVLSEDIILTLYTDSYAPSIVPLQILMAGLVFSFISFPIGALLNACNKQAVQTMIVGFALCVNIVLNTLLIPVHGVIGAAVAALIGNMLLTILGYAVIPKITQMNHWFIVRSILQLTIAAGCMGYGVWMVNDHVHFVVAIAVGILIYAIMLFVTQAVRIHDIREATLLLKRRS